MDLEAPQHIFELNSAIAFCEELDLRQQKLPLTPVDNAPLLTLARLVGFLGVTSSKRALEWEVSSASVVGSLIHLVKHLSAVAEVCKANVRRIS